MKKEHKIIHNIDGTFELVPDIDGNCKGCYYCSHIGNESICMYKLCIDYDPPCMPNGSIPGYVLFKINDETQISF